MGKRIFGTVDSFVETSEINLKLGRLVANFGFLRALLSYGDFDQFQIFCPTLDNLKLLQRRIEATVDESLQGRIVLSHHFNLRDALQETDFAAFHLSDWYWYMPKVAWLRARYARHPFPLSAPVHSLNGADMPTKVRELVDAPLRPGDSIFCTSTLGRSVVDHYLDRAVSPAMAQRPRTDLMPLGVSEEYFAQRERAACRQRLELPAQAFCLLYVGRLSVSTKADLVPLLYLLTRLRHEAAAIDGKPIDWKLVVAGGGDASDLANLRQATAELQLDGHVLLKPNVSDEDKLDLYGAADVFVSPVDNLQETFGLSVVEAMAGGLPVVASDFDGYRDLVREGHTGFRIPTLWGNPPDVVTDVLTVLEPNLSSLAYAQGMALDQEVFFDRLVTLAGNPDLCRRLGANGREVAQREYSWRSVIGRCDALWRELKAEATAAGATPDAVLPSRNDLRTVFHAYPSAHLAADTRVEQTPLAGLVLSGRMPMPATYADLSLLAPGELVPTILLAVGKGMLSLAELEARMAEKLGIQADYTGYQVAWLLKYGLLRQVPAT